MILMNIKNLKKESESKKIIIQLKILIKMLK